MARTSKMTPEIQNSIIESIENGLTYKQAAQLAGIDETTLHRWRRKGKQAGAGDYHQFMEAVKRARMKARLIHIQNIGDCGAGGQVVETVSEYRDANGDVVQRKTVTKEVLPSWRSSAWILERRFPSEFGKRAKPRPDEEHDPLQARLDHIMEPESEH